MAAACIVGPSHPHALRSAHTTHHHLLAALLPPNAQVQHLSHHHFAPGFGPHLSILHEATRNHIQLAVHTSSPVALPSPGQFTLHSPTGQQQISLPTPTHISLPSPNQLTFPAPTPPQLTVPTLPTPPSVQQLTLSPQGHPLCLPTSSGPRVSQALNLKIVTSTASSPTTTSVVLSASSTPAPPTRPATHEPSELRTLYVGNLDNSASEELLMAVFSHIGPVRSCKLIHEAGNDPYCFVEFADRSSAENALHTMNKRLCLGKILVIYEANLRASLAKSVMESTKRASPRHFIGAWV